MIFSNMQTNQVFDVLLQKNQNRITNILRYCKIV